MQLSTWKGSASTALMVVKQIESRWGFEKAKEYNPAKNCFTFAHWKAIGYNVKKGEKALRSVTIIEKKDQAGNVISKFPKSICLFFIDQVEKVNA